MPGRDILFDLTEFLHDPQRSGIQRVCHEIVAHWPQSSRLVPACVDSYARLSALPLETLDIYRAYFQASAAELPDLKKRMNALARQGQIVTARSFRSYHGLLNASVFSLPHQVEYYLWAARRGLTDRFFLFVHDVLLWTHPELFAPGFGINVFNYLRCLRAVPNLSFNSRQTRIETLERVLRDGRQPGPVCPLGAESLGTAAPTFDPKNRLFTVVGTIEPRKNHRAVLDAFDQLWMEGVNVELAFAGKLGWANEEVRQRIMCLKETQPCFHLLESLSDAQLVEAIRRSRATIYPALHEGYGLPPVESLALGVPVIVTESLPSIEMLSPEGQIRLAAPSAAAIGNAVRLLLDHSVAAQKVGEIDRLRLPTWSAMAQRLERWIDNPLAISDEPEQPSIQQSLARAG